MVILRPLNRGWIITYGEYLEITDDVAVLRGGPFDGCPIDDDSEED